MEVADLLQPVGPLSPSFFPGKDSAALDELLAGYITDAEQRAAGLPSEVQADAQTAWALWRAFDTIALRLATTPSSATQDGDSRAYSGVQATLMRKTADSYLDTFRTIEIAAAASTTGIRTTPKAGSVQLNFSS